MFSQSYLIGPSWEPEFNHLSQKGVPAAPGRRRKAINNLLHIHQYQPGAGMNEVLNNIYARRSVRDYSDKIVPEETVKEILKAGSNAPSGNNAQALSFVVIENRERMDHYSDIAKELFKAGMTLNRHKDEPVPENVQGLIKRLSNPAFQLFYHAPMAVFVFAAPSALTPVEDAEHGGGEHVPVRPVPGDRELLDRVRRFAGAQPGVPRGMPGPD